MFGIPLLIRSAALGTHRYDNRFRYVLDVDLSWQISKAEPAWHIPEVLIANRYHSGNSTWGWHSGAAKEYINLASKHGVALTTGEKRKIWLRSQRMSLEKRLFSAYERLASGLG